MYWCMLLYYSVFIIISSQYNRTIESLCMLNEWLARATLDVIFEWLHGCLKIFYTFDVLMYMIHLIVYYSMWSIISIMNVMMYLNIESHCMLNDWLARATLDVILDWLHGWLTIFYTFDVLMYMIIHLNVYYSMWSII